MSGTSAFDIQGETTSFTDRLNLSTGGNHFNINQPASTISKDTKGVLIVGAAVLAFYLIAKKRGK